jgi:hypothetical protein
MSCGHGLGIKSSETRQQARHVWNVARGVVGLTAPANGWNAASYHTVQRAIIGRVKQFRLLLGVYAFVISYG